jgi:hypothetical protein
MELEASLFLELAASLFGPLLLGTHPRDIATFTAKTGGPALTNPLLHGHQQYGAPFVYLTDAR